jgi:hypothetical protein
MMVNVFVIFKSFYFLIKIYLKNKIFDLNITNLYIVYMSLLYTLNSIKSSNLREKSPILFNNVKEIIDSRDPYYIKELYDFIRNESEKTTLLTVSVKDDSFNKKLIDNIHHFWNNYYTFFVGDSKMVFYKY